MIQKKSLGQNFLRDKNIIGSIVVAGQIHADDVVLEIGPGEGTMTANLLLVAGKVIAVEKDHRLIPVLQEKFKKEIAAGKFDIIEKDILEFDPSILEFYKHPYKVVANIPYYITGQIIRMFLETEHQPESMTLLVQKEVAERATTKAGKESLLSLSVKIFGDPKYVRTVKRGSFSPAPNVDSALFSIENISRKRLQGVDQKFFFKILHAGFAHKRKQLLPNLSELFPKEILTEAFQKIGIDPKARAEDVPLETWVDLCKTLSSKTLL